ncbi:MAG: iron response transcriptional regulator IrrA [Parvibaculaceae bacterium]
MTVPVKKSIIERLRAAGLRPTRQRVALADLLFGSGDRHVTAETLHEEAVKANVPVSLATIYNTLNQFTDAGLLREVAIEGQRTYFDTNTSNHFHYYLEADRKLMDIPSSELSVVGLPEAPEGTRVRRIDIIVRLETLRS